MQSASIPYLARKADSPSGREKGPEINSKTRRDLARSFASSLRNVCGAGRAASAARSNSGGRPGGCWESPSARCASARDSRDASRHGYKLVHVRRASGAMGAVMSKEIAEFVRDEFARVVTV
eukprot:6210834-Pleurochrysis_carterae.AAC.1